MTKLREVWRVVVPQVEVRCRVVGWEEGQRAEEGEDRMLLLGPQPLFRETVEGVGQ